VKGRGTVGEIALTTNEYKTAERLKNDYWRYAVFNCASTPEVHAVQDPSRLGWQPIVIIVRRFSEIVRCPVHRGPFVFQESTDRGIEGWMRNHQLFINRLFGDQGSGVKPAFGLDK
jgi:hypothetical protein